MKVGGVVPAASTVPAAAAAPVEISAPAPGKTPCFFICFVSKFIRRCQYNSNFSETETRQEAAESRLLAALDEALAETVTAHATQPLPAEEVSLQVDDASVVAVSGGSSGQQPQQQQGTCEDEILVPLSWGVRNESLAGEVRSMLLSILCFAKRKQFCGFCLTRIMFVRP